MLNNDSFYTSEDFKPRESPVVPSETRNIMLDELANSANTGKKTVVQDYNLYDFSKPSTSNTINLDDDQTIYETGRLQRFFTAFKDQKRYDELINQSSSKKNFIYSRMQRRNKIIEDLGIEAPSIFRPGLDGYNQEAVDYIENEVNKIRSSLPAELAATIPTYQDFLNEAKVNIEELEAILNTGNESDEGFFDQFMRNYLIESTEGEGIFGIPGTNNLLGVSTIKSLLNISHNYDISAKAGQLVGSLYSSLTDPINAAVSIFTSFSPLKIAGIIANTATGAASEGLITKYYINPWREELQLAQKNLEDVVKDSLLAGAAFNATFFGVAKLRNQLKKVSNMTTSERADKLLGGKIDNTISIEDYQVSALMDRITNNDGNIDELTNALNPNKYLRNTQDNIEKNLYTRSLEKIGIKEDIDGVGYFRGAPARALESTINNTEGLSTGTTTGGKLTYSDRLRTELTLSLTRSQTPAQNLVDYINTFSGNRATNIQDLVSIVESEMKDVKWRNVNKNSDINLDLPREIYNQVSENPAASRLSKAFKTLNTEVRRRYAKVGLELNEIENYLPQSHNETLLRATGFQKWSNFIEPLLDWEKIERAALLRSGRAISSRRLFLESSYRNIINNGVRPLAETLETIEKTGKVPYVAESSLRNRIRNEAERVLFFKDGDSYSNYHQEYGNYDNIISTIDSYIRRQSKNLTLLEQFGDNPGNTIKVLGDSLEQTLLDRANIKPDNLKEVKAARGEINTTRRLINNMYDNVIGNLHLGDVGATEKIINDGFNISLGSALSRVGIQSALLNPVFAALTGSRIGLNWINILTDHITTLQGLPRNVRRQLGLISELEMLGSGSTSRFDSVHGHDWSNKLLRGSLKYTGYYWSQDRTKSIFQKEFFRTLAVERRKTFEELVGSNEYLAKTFRENAINKNDWDLIRNISPIKYKELELLSPRQIYSDLTESNPSLELRIAADKFSKMILQEQVFAVPEGSIKGASLVGTSNVASRLIRPIITAPLLFTNFPLTAWYNTQKRWLHEPLNLAKLFLFAMSAGASYVALRDLNDGKIPKVDFKFFADSFYYSGLEPLPISWISDIFMNSFAKKDIFSLFGNFPVGGVKIAYEEYKKLVNNKGNPGRELVKLLRQNIPIKKFLGLDLIVNRLILDEIQKELDPEAYDYFRRSMQSARNRDQEYWWGPGQEIGQ